MGTSNCRSSKSGKRMQNEGVVHPQHGEGRCRSMVRLDVVYNTHKATPFLIIGVSCRGSGPFLLGHAD